MFWASGRTVCSQRSFESAEANAINEPQPPLKGAGLLIGIGIPPISGYFQPLPFCKRADNGEEWGRVSVKAPEWKIAEYSERMAEDGH